MWGLVEDAVALGIAFRGQAPPCPDDPGDEHVGYDDDAEREFGLTDEGRVYAKRMRAVLSAHGDDDGSTPGFSTHKVRDNNGWHVTKQECLQALASYDRAGVEHPESFRDDFIPFLRSAADHDGFEVY